MRTRFSAKWFVGAALFLSVGAIAAEHHIPSNGVSKGKLAPNGSEKNTAGLLSRPAVFRGTLGDMPIQLAVRPKEVKDEGLEGEYFIFGQSRKILVAGELESENLFLEESENGTNISGLWDGKLRGDTIVGTWTSADDSVSRPFSLKLIPPNISEQKVGTARKKMGASNPVFATSR